MIRLLNFSLFLLLALATALPAAAGEVNITYNGIKYFFYYSGSGASAVGDYAEVGLNTDFSGAAIIMPSVSFEYSYYSNGAYHSRTLTAPVIRICYSAFNGCSGLTSVTIPNSVTSISSHAFDGCSGLTSVTIPNSVTLIGDGVFLNCTSLSSVTIPNSISSIPNYMFKGCSSLTSLASITIPNSVTSIGSHAFQDCSGLTSVTIPNSIKTIADNAFNNCSNLASATIGNSVTSISGGAFSECSSLTSVTIGNSVTTIDGYAFYNCNSLTSVALGSSVTNIGTEAFRNCYGLMSVTCLAENPPFCGRHAFDDRPSATLYVPAGSLYEYMTTDPWYCFYSIQPIEQEYSISLNETNAVIEKGDFVQLRATVTPDDGYAPQVTWSSSNPSVASVDEWGTVTGMGPGEAVITARAGSASATCRVKVVQHTVTLDKSSASIQLYSTLQLNATVTPHDGYEPTVVWSSSRPGVATVTQDGLVKGYMTGTATITARAGQSTATCVVTVTPILATGIALNTYQEEMTVGEVTRIIAYVAPLDVTNGNVSWSVSDNGVISASWNGNECLVIAEKAGTATVTARTTDGTNLSATCVIKVNSSEPVYIPVESITLNKSTLQMNVNTTRHLTATVLPTYASDRSVSWSSSNPNVVTVDANGAVTASRMGTAVITATTNGVTALGNHLEVKCVVTVLASGGNTDVLPGDVNGDGVVNITDVTALIRYILNGGATGIDLDNADVNQDGTINISDVTVLIRLILND